METTCTITPIENPYLILFIILLTFASVILFTIAISKEREKKRLAEKEREENLNEYKKEREEEKKAEAEKINSTAECSIVYVHNGHHSNVHILN